MVNSRPKGGPASFRPSELSTKHKGTFETTESLTPTRHWEITPRRFFFLKKSFRPAQSTRPVTLPFYFSSLSPHPTHFLSKPFHVERNALFAVTVPHENFAGTVIRKKTTLSSPNMRPSFLGREGPLPCGSSMPLARAPNPRETALPLHWTNPAQRLQWPSTRCCAHTLHRHQR